MHSFTPQFSCHVVWSKNSTSVSSQRLYLPDALLILFSKLKKDLKEKALGRSKFKEKKSIGTINSDHCFNHRKVADIHASDLVGLSFDSHNLNVVWCQTLEPFWPRKTVSERRRPAVALICYAGFSFYILLTRIYLASNLLLLPTRLATNSWLLHPSLRSL